MEGMGDEVVELEEIAHLKGKESNWPESSPRLFMDTLEGNGINKRLASELPLTIPCNRDDGGDMIEELTLNNYEKSNFVAVGSSNSQEVIPIRQGQWQHLYQLKGGLGNTSSREENVSKDKEPVKLGDEDDIGSIFRPEFWVQNLQSSKQSNQDHKGISERLLSSDNNAVDGITLSPSGTRTKVLSSSGFTQFFVKNSLKGKGVACRYPEAREGFGVVGTGQNNEKAACVTKIVSNTSVNLGAKPDNPPIHGVVGTGQNNEKAACVTKIVSNTSVNLGAKPNDPSIHGGGGAGPDSFNDGISLTEWLRPGFRKVNKDESLHIFRQIVKLVDCAHSQRVALQDVRPSSFKLFPSNRVKYVGPLAQRDLLESVMVPDVPNLEHCLSRKKFPEEGLHPLHNSSLNQQKLGEKRKFARQHGQLWARSGYKREMVQEVDVKSIDSQDSGCFSIERYNSNSERRPQNKSSIPIVTNSTRQLSMSAILQSEEKWYSSPEELNERVSTFSSNIYCLGVLLFELLNCFDSWEVHATAMSDLRHRILPPIFLSKYPMEAGFCFLLLHPESSSRPTTREILQSKLLCESLELLPEDHLPLSTDEDEAESDLLFHFLTSLNEQKQQEASKLVEDIGCLEADIEEVEKRHILSTTGVLCRKHKYASNTGEPGFHLEGPGHLEVSNTIGARLMGSINELENAYFSMRFQSQLPEADAIGHSDKDLLRKRERRFLVQNESDGQLLNQKPTDRLGVFFDGLCKYARYTKFEVRGTLINGDLLNSANVICSLSFDRDEDYFAAACVSRKIKIFEFQGLLDDSVDIHYPVIEMLSKSKLSCICWNNYVNNHLASTDYDGVVQLWDASTGQGFSQYTEHEKRAWSVDFSHVDPTKLASGSDDCTVKLWTINERKCIGTIRNIANVCCVQFSAHSTHLLAFGSSDCKTYCYDMRNTRTPWCTLAGHGKAVSYVKFLDPETLVSASTDNTLKLWDLNKTSSSGLSTNACSLTFRGHTNEKNFVGLTVSDGYIACGSESNEVYSYYRSLPMPITSHKFGSINPTSGKEIDDDNGQFVSSVCWRGKSDMVVAANSSGSIKLLQMV